MRYHHFPVQPSPRVLVLPLLVATSLLLPSLVRAAVSEFLVVQTHYSFPDGANKILVSWDESDAAALPAEIHLNGVDFAHVEGGAGHKDVTIVVPDFGFYLIEATSGIFPFAQVDQVVEESPPVGDARLDVVCNGGAAGEECEITIIFTNPGPPADTFKISVNGQEAAQVTGEIVDDKEVRVQASGVGERCITMEGSLKREDGNYVGHVTKACCDLKCKPEVVNRFIRGVCDGASSAPDIGTVIFGLRHLFQGRGTPPCNEACDANADSRIDLTDMVYTLHYLFQGGPAPQPWNDRDGDGRKDPTCESADEGRCGASSNSCPP